MGETQNNDEKVVMHTPVGYSATPTHTTHLGPILAVIVLMLVLIAGGLYLWGGALEKERVLQEEIEIVNNEPETPRAEADTQILETLSPSDDLDAIEADITSTNLDSLETDLTAVDAEIEASLP